MMDAITLMKKFQEFIELFYMEELQNQLLHDKSFINLDFSKLSQFSPDLSDILLENPKEIMGQFETAIEQIQLSQVISKFKIRFFNLAFGQRVSVKNVRSKHIGKFLAIEGVIKQKGDVRPIIISAKFECPSCGNVHNILQEDEEKFTEPSKCSCGRKGKFKLLETEKLDFQGIVLEESTDNLEDGSQPRRLRVVLKNDLTSPMSERRTNPGSKVRISGVVTEIFIPAKDGGKQTKLDIIFDANHIEAIQEDFSDIEISPEKEEEILALSKDPKIIQKLISSFAPGIFGHEQVKEAILYQFVGGVQKKRSDGVKNRGDIHILLIGDPGAGL